LSARWLLRSIPEESPGVLFCFPYSGVGASSYRQWPRKVAGMTVVPLQPPGRENRIREQRPATHRDFALSLITELETVGSRSFGFFGHCGAVPYMLETVFLLQDRGSQLPDWLISSSWGPPHKGLYGDLNFVDLQTHDFASEVVTLSARMGIELPAGLVDMAAELLQFDQTVQRGYQYPSGAYIPVPVAAIGWSRDDIVPADIATAGWEEVASVQAHVLAGGHGEYLRCPAQLRDLIDQLRSSPSRLS
jgi:surfactin synthase thioesterase subunit